MTEHPSGSEEPAGGFMLSDPRPVEQEERGSFLRELPILVVVALAVAIVLKTLVVQAFFIPSGSMEPTLDPGDRVLVQKVVYGPGRGDVIVFSDPQGRPGPDRGILGGFVHWLSGTLGIERPEHDDFIKRVIGLPGETVELRDGRLLVDGVRIQEPYLKGAVDTRDYGPVRVPEGSLFVLGDNRLNSNDSRFGLGFVPVDKVVGRAFAIVWPPSRAGWIH
ncbi:MAG TPA: signal peptidase I [Actinomycetota bacterium]|nr:signal peptidase I [Actinomycetota bacterium]